MGVDGRQKVVHSLRRIVGGDDFRAEVGAVCQCQQGLDEQLDAGLAVVIDGQHRLHQAEEAFYHLGLLCRKVYLDFLVGHKAGKLFARERCRERVVGVVVVQHRYGRALGQDHHLAAVHGDHFHVEPNIGATLLHIYYPVLGALHYLAYHHAVSVGGVVGDEGQPFGEEVLLVAVQQVHFAAD